MPQVQTKRETREEEVPEDEARPAGNFDFDNLVPVLKHGSSPFLWLEVILVRKRNKGGQERGQKRGEKVERFDGS